LLLIFSFLVISCGGSSPSGANNSGSNNSNNNNSGTPTSNYYFTASGSTGVSVLLSWSYSEVLGSPYSGTVTAPTPYTSPNFPVVTGSGNDFSVCGSRICTSCSSPWTLTIYNSNSVAVTQTWSSIALDCAQYIEP
jgi:hypothetical protein